MDIQDKTREELIIELQELKQVYHSLKVSTEADIVSQKQTMEALQASEERFQLLFNKAPLGYQSLDFEGNFIEVNQQWLDTLGYNREEVIGKWFGDFLTPAYQDGFRKRFPIFKAQGHIHSEFEMVHKNGSVLFIAFDGRIGYDLNGNFKQTHCILQDITERKQAKEEHERLSKHNELILGSVAEGILGLDLKGKHTFINPAAAKMLGYEANELLGQPSHSLWHHTKADGSLLPEEECKIYATLNTGIICHSGNEVFWRKDGTSFPVEYTSTPIIDQGLLAGSVLTFTDITERKQAEQALRESEENLSITLHSIGDGVISTDKNGLVVQMNPVAETLCGWQLSDAAGKPLAQVFRIVNAETHQSVTDPVKKVLEKGEIIGLANHTILVSKNGAEYQIADSAAPIKTKQGEITGVVLVFSDITGSYIAQKQIKESEERYRSLLNNLEAGIVVHAPDTSIVFNNQRASELLGLTDKQMRGKAAIDTAWKFIHEDNTPLTLDEYPVNRIVNGRQSITNQILGIHQPVKKDIVWVNVNGFPVQDTKGKISEVVISFIDITERKQSEILLQGKTEEIAAQNEEYQQINEELIQTNQELAEARKNAEINEARMKLAFEISKSGAWDWDILKNTFYWSDEFLQVFGLPENTTAGFEAWIKALHPDDIERASIKIQEAIENRTELLNDYRIILPNKEIRWIRSTGHTTYLNNNPARMIGLCMDITDQKIAEKELHEAIERAEESEKKYFSLFNEMINGFAYHKIILDENNNPFDYTFINVNPAFELLTGLKAKDIIGKTAWDVMPENDKYWAEIYGKVALTGESIQFENFASGLNKHFRVIAYCPEIGYFATIFEDITERKQKEIELQKAKEYAEVNSANITAIIEGTKENIWAFNKNYEILYLNKAFQTDFQQTFGKRLEPGVNLIQSHPESIRHFWKLRYDRVLNNEQFTEEDAIETGNGIIYVQVSFTPIVKKGEVIGGSCIGSNITNRKLIELELTKAKEHAEESDRLKSAFLANMSHEIRTPMNGILGFTDLLQDPDLSSEAKRNYINLVHISGQRMLNTVNDIIEISKIEAGMVFLNKEKTNVSNKVSELVQFFRPEAAAKGLTLTIEKWLPESDSTILTDAQKLYSILNNLIKNAIKFTDKGSIDVGYHVVEKIHEFSLQQRQIQFYVKDTGIGIPADRKEAIFDRFVQADIGDRRAFQGSGLGLSISKANVEMLGGTIWVESEEYRGSTFYFTLPYDPGNKEERQDKIIASSPQKVSMKTNNVSGLKILITEDDEVSDALISIIAEQFGREILKAETGKSAVGICQNNPDIDLILMDLKMPVMDGLEATRQIRQFNKDVVIIAQTAYGLSGDREKAIEAGCNDYIAKPIRNDELKELIQKYFNK